MGRNIDEKFQIAKWEIDLIGKKKKENSNITNEQKRKVKQRKKKKKDLSVSGMKIQLAVRFLLLY